MKVLHSTCQQIWKTQQWPQNHKRSVFIPIPKKGNANVQTMFTIALISYASKVKIKILQARLQQYVNLNFQMFKLDLEKAEELPTSAGSSKKQENSRKTSTSALLTTSKPLTVWITTNWKIPQEMGIPHHLTCLLRNLFTGQEATVRTRHRTTDRFQIGKGIHQGCILSPCLFNLYAEYIMKNAGLKEAQARIRLPGEISVTSDIKMTPPFWQKVKKN